MVRYNAKGADEVVSNIADSHVYAFYIIEVWQVLL